MYRFPVYACGYNWLDSNAVAAMLGPVFEHIADTMVDAFTRRADSLHGHDAR